MLNLEQGEAMGERMVSRPGTAKGRFYSRMMGIIGEFGE